MGDEVGPQGCLSLSVLQMFGEPAPWRLGYQNRVLNYVLLHPRDSFHDKILWERTLVKSGLMEPLNVPTLKLLHGHNSLGTMAGDRG